MLNKNLFFLIIILFIISSCKENIYKNKKYRYKVEFPVNWIALNSNINRKEEEKFKNKIENENSLTIYKNVDVSFYNPNSEPPVYDIISISTIPKVINIDNILINKNEVDATLEYQLRQFFSNVNMISSEFKKFNSGKSYIVDFILEYKTIKCYASTVILTTNLFYSNMITSISKEENRFNVLQIRDQIINSFKRY